MVTSPVGQDEGDFDYETGCGRGTVWVRESFVTRPHRKAE